MLVKFFLKEALYIKKSIIMMLIMIFLGVFSLFFVQKVADSLNFVISLKNKELLGGDVEVMSRYFIPRESREKLKSLLESFEISEERLKTSMFTMVNAKGAARLSYLSAFDSPPIYGNYSFKIGESYQQFPKIGKVWVSKELSDLLKVRVGEQIQIGDASLELTKVVSQDPEQGFGFSLAGTRVYMNLKDLEASKLVQKGSTVRYYYHLKTLSEVSEKEIERISEELGENSLKIQSASGANSRLQRSVGIAQKSLGLISLSALFLSLFGFFSITKSRAPLFHNNDRILNELGVSFLKIISARLVLPFFLFLFSSLVLIVIASFFEESLVQYLQKVLSIDLHLKISFQMIILFIAIFSSYCVSFYLAYLPDLKLSKSHEKKRSLFTCWSFLILCLFIITFFVYGSFLQGSLILILFALMVFLFKIFLTLVLKSIDRIKVKSFFIKHIKLYLCRYDDKTSWMVTIFVFSLSLVFFLSSFESGLVANFEQSDIKQRPSHFLFDIQDNQREPFVENLKGMGAQLRQMSPLIVSKFLSVNKLSLKNHLTKELGHDELQKIKNRSNRGVNLSYRKDLLGSEHIVDEVKENLQKKYLKEGQPTISLEENYARRYHLELEDRLVFDVMGVPVTGVVSSIRKINWLSFDPNFFIQFNDSLLEDAPKTWVSSISLKEDKSLELYELISKKYPNISVIDVGDVLTRIMSILEIVFQGVYFVNSSVLALGVLLVGLMFFNHIKSRYQDYGVMLSLGLSFKDVKKILRLEFLSILLFSILFSFLLSCIGNAAVFRYALNLEWSFDVDSTILLLGSLTLSGFVFVELLVQTIEKVTWQALKREN